MSIYQSIVSISDDCLDNQSLGRDTHHSGHLTHKLLLKELPLLPCIHSTEVRMFISVVTTMYVCSSPSRIAASNCARTLLLGCPATSSSRPTKRMSAVTWPSALPVLAATCSANFFCASNCASSAALAAAASRSALALTAASASRAATEHT